MPSEYTTKSGDTWGVIAHRALGSDLFMHLMIDANPDHNFVARFDAEVVLNVPDLPAPKLKSGLPPWRRP